MMTDLDHLQAIKWSGQPLIGFTIVSGPHGLTRAIAMSDPKKPLCPFSWPLWNFPQRPQRVTWIIHNLQDARRLFGGGSYRDPSIDLNRDTFIYVLPENRTEVQIALHYAAHMIVAFDGSLAKDVTKRLRT